VFVAEVPQSTIGHSGIAAQAHGEGFPDRGCVLLLACKYVVAYLLGRLAAFSFYQKLSLYLYSSTSLPSAQIKPASSRATLVITFPLGLPFMYSRW